MPDWPEIKWQEGPDIVMPEPETFYIVRPPVPKWEMCLNGNWELRFCLASAPNWFHRWAQRVCLGIHWRRVQQ